jgi:hypothetical protein
MLTSFVMFAGFPPSKMTREKLTLAIRFVVLNGCGLVMTKLNVVPLFGFNGGRSFVPPTTHLADCPIISPCLSSKKQSARADSTFSARLFVIAKEMTAFCPMIFGGERITANCARAVTQSNMPMIPRSLFIRFQGEMSFNETIQHFYVVRLKCVSAWDDLSTDQIRNFWKAV